MNIHVLKASPTAEGMAKAYQLEGAGRGEACPRCYAGEPGLFPLGSGLPITGARLSSVIQDEGCLEV